MVLLQNMLALGVTYFANTVQGESTDSESYVQSEIDLVFLLAAFLLGFADNGIMTCIYAIIAEKFGDHCLVACVLCLVSCQLSDIIAWSLYSPLSECTWPSFGR